MVEAKERPMIATIENFSAQQHAESNTFCENMHIFLIKLDGLLLRKWSSPDSSPWYYSALKLS